MCPIAGEPSSRVSMCGSAQAMRTLVMAVLTIGAAKVLVPRVALGSQ